MIEMLQQKGRFYPFFLTNFRRKHQDATQIRWTEKHQF